MELSQFKKSFQWGAKVQVPAEAGGNQKTRTVKPALGWPRVQVLERTRDGSSPWKVLKASTF